MIGAASPDSSDPVPLARIPLDPVAEAVVMVDAVPTFERIGIPEVLLGPGEVLVAIEFATVCGSDRHTVAGIRAAPTPLVLGHEQVGRIVAFGVPAPTTVDGRPLAVDDLIVWGIAVDCGECTRCAAGFPNKCERLRKFGHERMTDAWALSGGIATHAHLPARIPIVLVPQELPAEVAAPASCATATIVAAIEAVIAVRALRAAVVLVSGCGMLGLTAVAMLRDAGAIVVAVDPDASRRELAVSFGAHATAAPGLVAVRDALASVSPEAAWDVAIDVSGSGTAIEDALALAGIGGVLVLVGSVFPAPPIRLSAEAVVRSLVTIRGVHNYRPEHLVDAVAFLRTLEPADLDRFSSLVALIVPFSRAEDALLRDPPSGARIGIRF
jgi:putative phosphonate catabolism associated alcohol dehydrogenase